MKDELPLALIEEQAERDVSADGGGENRQADGFGEPDGMYGVRWGGGLICCSGLGCGAGHGVSVFECSIERGGCFAWLSG